MKIYIAGSGAMGCRFGYHLVSAGEDVTLLDNWDAQIEAIRTDGLHIIGDRMDVVHVPIMKPSEASEPADLIVVFTKAMELANMLESIQKIIQPTTRVLCLLNGLGHEEVMKEYVDAKQILMGATVWTAGLAGPGVARLIGTGSINFQAIDPNGEQGGVEVAEVLSKAGLNAIYDHDVLKSIWRKATVNGTMNATCSLVDCTIGQLFSSATGLAIVKRIVHEFAQVANAEGVHLEEASLLGYVMEVSVDTAKHHPSMHQDLIQNHRQTEIDYLNGAVVRKAEAHGIDTPYCKLITQLIHTKEDVLGIR